MIGLMILLLGVGALFMIAGTMGLLRFPDLPTRLHAVAKADNLGLGFIMLGLIVHTVSNGVGAGVVAKLVLIWVLALIGTAVNSHLLATREDDR